MICFVISNKNNHFKHSAKVIKIENSFIFYFKDKNKDNVFQIDKGGLKIIFPRGLYGELPLFYTMEEDYIYIFSHFKAAAKLGLKFNEDKERLAEFLNFGFIYPPYTIYKNVRRVLFDEILEIKLGKKNKVIIRKEKIFSKGPKKENASLQIGKFLDDNILKLIQGNKKTTTLFSGGLDSSLLAKILQNNKRPLNTISTSFNFKNKDEFEMKNALSASRELKVENLHKKFTKKDFLTNLIWTIYFSEEPITHMQSVLLYSLFEKFKRNFSKKILNGQGADGVFGQAIQYRLNSAKEKFDTKEVLNPINDFLWFSKNLGISKKNILKNRLDFLDSLKNLRSQDKIFIFDMLGDVDITQTCWRKCAESRKLQIIYPYLNKKLIQMVSEVSWSEKLKEPKHILRQIARERKVPKNIIERKKGNFGPISDQWGKDLSPLFPLCTDFFDISFLNKLKIDKTKRYILWNLINLCIWRRLFLLKQNPKKLIESINFV